LACTGPAEWLREAEEKIERKRRAVEEEIERKRRAADEEIERKLRATQIYPSQTNS
jgi:F0F1-type ATP synthase membrane subunit b/b'